MKNKTISLFGDHKVVQNKGVKYSELLEKFMDPFKNEFLGFEYLEDILEFTVSAWNFGNMKLLIPNKEFNKIIATAPNEDVNLALLKKMVASKVKNFKAYNNFIVDFELVETSGEPILRVVTESEESYLSNMMHDEEGQITEDDFEENYINRNAIVLKPLKPFFDWHNNLYPDDEIDEASCEANIYLVTDENDDVENWLKKKFDKFFMMELEDWHTNKKEWPQRRNYKMFKQWFHVEISTMIYDMEKEPVLKLV